MSNSINTDLISNLSIQEKQNQAPKTNELGRDAFLELMITQMQNQSPLDPQSNSEFVAQLAQFSSVEGLDKLNSSMDGMASNFESNLEGMGQLNTTMDGMASNFQSNQALQASSMVGREVTVNSDQAQLGANGSVDGNIHLPFNTGELTLEIYNSKNQLVSTQLMGATKAGEVAFSWDGKGGKADEQMPAGTYHFRATTSYNGEDVELDTALTANVDSVTINANNTITLNVAGVGPVSLSQLKEIL